MKTPQLPPLIIKKSPSAFYVYTYKNKWDPEKKRSYRASFKKVGTVTSGEKEGRIRWDDHFLAERPELRDFICERKGKDYVFTPMNEGGFTLSQAMEVKQLHAELPGTGSARCSISHWRSSQNSLSSAPGLSKSFIDCVLHHP